MHGGVPADHPLRVDLPEPTHPLHGGEVRPHRAVPISLPESDTVLVAVGAPAGAGYQACGPVATALSRSFRSRSQTHCGDFISGVVDFLGEISESQLPTVYLTETAGEDGEANVVVPFELASPTFKSESTTAALVQVAYRALNATFCMFMRAGSAPLDMDALGEFLDAKLSTIASKIGEGISGVPRSIVSEVPFHFIYYNPDSLSLRTSLPSATSALHLAPTQLPPSSVFP